MTQLRPLFAALGLLLAGLALGQAQTPAPAAPTEAAPAARIAAAFPVLDKIYADFAAQRHVPGLAYGLVVDGQLVHTGAVGYTNVAARTAVTSESVFRIASAPGVGYEYSNLGFALLGRLVTRVSGQPVQACISEKILGPLGMSHTTWDYQQVPAAHLAHGYGAATATGPEEPLLPTP